MLQNAPTNNPHAHRRESNGSAGMSAGSRKNSADHSAKPADPSGRRKSNATQHEPTIKEKEMMSVPAVVFEKRRSSFTSETPIFPSASERRGSVDVFEGLPMGRRASINPMAPKMDPPDIRHDKHDTEGSRIILECRIESDNEPLVDWFHLDEAVKGSRYKRDVVRDGDKWLATLAIKNITRKDAGKYTVKAKNSCGESFAVVFSYIEKHV